MLAPRDVNQTPPNLWRYKHPTTGVVLGYAHSLGRVYAIVKDYCKANDLPDIPNLEREIIQYICHEEPSYCVSTTPPTFAQRAATFMGAARDWVASGFKSITHEQYEERLGICEACPYWKGSAALGLGACGKCGCSGLKLYLPSQVCPDGRWKAIHV